LNFQIALIARQFLGDEKLAEQARTSCECIKSFGRSANHRSAL
jgi:hypothetical protein